MNEIHLNKLNSNQTLRKMKIFIVESCEIVCNSVIIPKLNKMQIGKRLAYGGFCQDKSINFMKIIF